MVEFTLKIDAEYIYMCINSLNCQIWLVQSPNWDYSWFHMKIGAECIYICISSLNCQTWLVQSSNWHHSWFHIENWCWMDIHMYQLPKLPNLVSPIIKFTSWLNSHLWRQSVSVGLETITRNFPRQVNHTLNFPSIIIQMTHYFTFIVYHSTVITVLQHHYTFLSSLPGNHHHLITFCSNIINNDWIITVEQIQMPFGEYRLSLALSSMECSFTLWLPSLLLACSSFKNSVSCLLLDMAPSGSITGYLSHRYLFFHFIACQP